MTSANTTSTSDDLNAGPDALQKQLEQCIDSIEYDIIGQEQDGTFLLSWTVLNNYNFGMCKINEKNIVKLHKVAYTRSLIVVQATISQNAQYFAFVTKTVSDNKFTYFYHLTFRNIINCSSISLPFRKIFDEDPMDSCDLQTFVQFLYDKNSRKNSPSKFIIMQHRKFILLGEIINDKVTFFEKIVNEFFWSQWEPVNQTLFYAHVRNASFEQRFYENFKPILSAIQFVDGKTEYEHVLNISLNIPDFNNDTGTDIYEEDVIPLRIHDTSIDLEIVLNKKGMLFICHHYFFQETRKYSNEDDDSKQVQLAYSITPLHHNCIIHCTFNDMQWSYIRNIKPVYKIYRDNFLMVFLPGLFVHLLDIGLSHEPCCHVITKIDLCTQDLTDVRLVPILGYGEDATLDLNSLNIVKLSISDDDLLKFFETDENFFNKLSIIHYLMYHRKQANIATNLLSKLTDNFIHKDYVDILKEFLVCGTFETMEKTLPAEANILINLLPMTTIPNRNNFEFHIDSNLSLNVTQRTLRYTSMMLISPQQRLCSYVQDIWTLLWDNLTLSEKRKERFSSDFIVDKLTLSLVCYQPEALSKCATPMSPAKINSSLNEFLSKSAQNEFPFYEIESCTANKQEHVQAVISRELSMYLLKHGSGNFGHKRFEWKLQTPTYIHAVTSRYVQTLSEQSKLLCSMLYRFNAIRCNISMSDKGFSFINRLSRENRKSLFMLFERYYLAIESLAYPLPHGFMPFFTYLGYCSLPFSEFLEYANRKVFDLQIDVMKLIINDYDKRCDTSEKLKLLSIMPPSRAKRVLNQWNSQESISIRSKECVRNVLLGAESEYKKLSNINKNEHETFLPALDSFLNLLTAKASLADLDFSLIIDSVSASKKFLEANRK